MNVPAKRLSSKGSTCFSPLKQLFSKALSFSTQKIARPTGRAKFAITHVLSIIQVITSCALAASHQGMRRAMLRRGVLIGSLMLLKK
jgi:hypothetical protein